MRVDEIFNLLEDEFSAKEVNTWGGSVIYRKQLMSDFFIDFIFKGTVCTMELNQFDKTLGPDITYFRSQYWINDENFKNKIIETIIEYTETAKSILQRSKLNKIKEDFV